ncbi:MAG: oligosaccharide flippase family protein [Pseudomonadota bacterium]
MHTVKKRLNALNQSNAATLGGGTALTAMIRFVSTSILTRLLAPEAFAIAVVINSIVTSLELMSDFGIKPFVIRDKEEMNETTGDVIWTIQMLRGCFLSAMMWIWAPGLAQAFANPDTVDYIRVAAIIPLVNGLRSLGEPLAARAGVQRVNERILVLRAFFSSLGTIAFAIWLRNPWAIVLGITLAAFTNAAIDWIVFRRHWRLKFRFDRGIFLRVLNFSKYLFFSSILTLVISQVDKLVVARNFSLETVGLYGMAMTLLLIMTTMITSYTRSVFFPDVAQAIRDERLDLKAMRKAMGIAPLVFLYLSGGAIGGGQIFFQIIFDDRYLFGGVIFSVIAMRGIVLTVSDLAANTEVAFGNTRHTLEMNIIIMAWIAVTIPLLMNAYGVLGLAAAVGSINLLPALIGTYRVYRRGLFVPSYYVLGALMVGAGVFTGVAGTWLIKVAAAALSIPL